MSWLELGSAQDFSDQVELSSAQENFSSVNLSSAQGKFFKFTTLHLLITVIYFESFPTSNSTKIKQKQVFFDHNELIEILLKTTLSNTGGIKRRWLTSTMSHVLCNYVLKAAECTFLESARHS